MSSRTSLIRWLLCALVATAAACSHESDGELDASAGSRSDLAEAPRLDASLSTDLAELPTFIDPNGKGGTAELLSFTVFGDVRPAVFDNNAGYPTTVATAIFNGMAAQQAQFAVGTGDYMFVELLASAAQAQLASLMTAAKGFSAPIFYGMGNHECNSISELNCPNLDESVNITAYLQTLVPFTPVPWFDFVIHTSLGDAKFLFIAPNAWNDAQAAWLTQALQRPTKYTFVVRHEPTPDAGRPAYLAGVTASDTLLASVPVTLYLFGHVHQYLHLATNRVIAGNAGAPLDTGDYGWLNVRQRADSTILVTAYSMSTGMPIDSWAVTTDGQAATP